MPTRILLADDEPHITHVVAHKLRGAGLEVIVAEDGEEAYELALEHDPTVIVTDLQMPYLSGIELAQRLAENESTSATPRPSSGKSTPLTADTSTKRRPDSEVWPRLRKQQFFSRPLKERPVCTKSKSACCGPESDSSCDGAALVVPVPCDTTCRQKKLHKSPVSSVVI